MKDGVKECYVFENKEDPNCPIILHFPLVNEDFREYKAPGEYHQLPESILEISMFILFKHEIEENENFVHLQFYCVTTT